MDNLAALTHQLEYLFLRKIIDGLRDTSIPLAEAKAASTAFLTIEPFTSGEDAHTKIITFTAQYPKFTELQTYINAYQSEKENLEKVTKMKTLIKQNNIDAALAVAHE